MKAIKENLPLVVFCSVLALISVLNLIGISMISPKAEEFASSGQELPGSTLAAIHVLNFLMPLAVRIFVSLFFSFVVWKFPKVGVKIVAAVVIPVSLLILVGVSVPYL